MKGVFYAILISAAVVIGVGSIGVIIGLIPAFLGAGAVTSCIIAAVGTFCLSLFGFLIPLPGLLGACIGISLSHKRPVDALGDAGAAVLGTLAGGALFALIGGFWGVSLALLVGLVLGGIASYMISGVVLRVFPH